MLRAFIWEMGEWENRRWGPLSPILPSPILLLCIVTAGLLLLGWEKAGAQGGMSVREGWGVAAINPAGEGFAVDYATPALHKWYEPRHLPETYLHPWYEVQTNYAQEFYTRYVNRQLEGEEAYDVFGNQLGRGWLVYSWTQEQPGPRGSTVDKRLGGLSSQRLMGDPRGAYRYFFDRLVIASDRQGESAFRLMIGDEIWTRFTPLTFYKPRFNGVRLDGANDRYSGSLLLSRSSNPDEESQSNATTVMGGHAEVQVGPSATLGLTYVNAHNVLTQVEFDEGNPLHGILTARQNRPLDRLWVRVRDDSPGSGQVGAALAGFDIVLVDTSGRQLRGREIGFLPTVQGGRTEGGRLVAEDSEEIVLEYDLGALDFENIQSDDLRQVRVELSVANDYRIEVASDLQTDGDDFNPEIVFLPVRRAAGNVQDDSNTRTVALDYGLPTGTEILGMDWNLMDWGGLSLTGELALNRRFRRYPNPEVRDHHEIAEVAHAAYLNAAYRTFSWLFFLEAFSIEQEYRTWYWLTDRDGRLKYKNPVPQIYEFVDDDDDLNGLTEWQRPYFARWGSFAELSTTSVQSTQREVAWPGLDENGDFINDHNQNLNLIPDYDEPFLRFGSDRPEFLFGMDMNHNGWIDRFENDERPDYPYRSDHRGFNAYAQVEVNPALQVTVGRQQMRLVRGDGRTQAWYGLATWKRLFDRGRLRLFAHGARVHDDIADDLRQWFQPVGAPGRMQEVFDPLPARDAWEWILYADLEHWLGSQVRFFHRGKWNRTLQRDPRAALRLREGRKGSGFLGVIDRVEWRIPLGLGVLEPRWKSEFRKDRPFSTRQPAATSLEETFFLLWTQPLFAEQVGVSYFPRYGRQLFNTEIQFGLEAGWFWLLEGTREEVEEDFATWTIVGQLTNRTAYEGYQVVTRTGVQFGARNFDQRADQESSLVFMTVHAGLGR